MATSTIKNKNFIYAGQKTPSEEFNIPTNASVVYCIAYQNAVTDWETVSVIFLSLVGDSQHMSAQYNNMKVTFFYKPSTGVVKIANQTNITNYRVYYRL